MKTASRSLVFTVTLLAASLAQAASFSTFGAGTTAFDVSADGLKVVGTLGTTNWAWTSGVGFDTSMGGTVSGYSQISADGSTLLAQLMNPATAKTEPAIYNFATRSWTLLGSNGGGSGTTSGSAYELTPDGRYVGGASYTGAAASTFHATIWDTTTLTHVDVGNGVQSRINALSDDASIAVGYSTSSQTASIWRRQPDGSYLQSSIIRPDGTTALSQTYAVSSNGLFAAGASFNTALPYYYNVTTGVATYFPKLPYLSANLRSVASPSGITNDGQTIIGTHSILGTLNTNHGFIWNAGFGVMEIDDYFAGFGVDISNAYDFVSPITMKVMGDGTMMVLGIAKDNASGGQIGFMVNVPMPAAVPEPVSYAMFAAGLGMLALARRRLTARRGE